MITKVISIRPSPELRARLEHLATATERDITWFVLRCLEAQLPVFEERLKLQLEAMRLKQLAGPPLTP
jgi:predicted transcriptional regulator